MPPPIPTGERQKRPTARKDDELFGPPLGDAARAEQLAKEVAATTDPASAAILAYELGEIYERRIGDETRAIEAYRRAIERDASFKPSGWALRRVLYRLARWTEIAALIDDELPSVTNSDERADLLFERGMVTGHAGSDKDSRAAFEAALQLAPRHQAALVALERIVTRTADPAGLIAVWRLLAEAVETPERRIAYLLEVAKASGNDDEAVRAALSTAASVAETCATPSRLRLAEQIARQRLRIAEAGGEHTPIAEAIEALVHALVSAEASGHPKEPLMRTVARRHEVAALHRRQAHLYATTAPERSWKHLEMARTLAPDELVVLADMLELADTLGHRDDLPDLARRWRSFEDEVGRAELLSVWCAEGHLGTEQLRSLLTTRQPTAPGFILLTALTESRALRDPSPNAHLELATAYIAGARAAANGTWIGLGSQPDARAAAALYVQAIDLFTNYITPPALEQARDALAEAHELAPDEPALRELSIEIDEATHAGRTPSPWRGGVRDRASVERAIRSAHRIGRPDAVIPLQHELARIDPSEPAHAWCLDALLAEADLDKERGAILSRLAASDPEPARRQLALFELARIHERDGDVAAAITAYRAVLVASPAFTPARAALVDLLRVEQRWSDLADERCAEARVSQEPQTIRCALREAGWVVEARLGDSARAAQIYATWLERLPDERTALEGLARCHAASGDHASEIAPRAAIVKHDRTPAAAWLYARALERAGNLDEALEEYRKLATLEDPPMAAVSSGLAIADLATRRGDLVGAVDAIESIAERTSDARFAAGLYEHCGWTAIIALGDIEVASRAFAAAVALDPELRGARLGAMFVATRRGDLRGLATAQIELANSIETQELVAGLRLRAAAIAIASGESELADTHVAEALRAAPDNPAALVVAAGARAPRAEKTNDPFAASEHLVARADVLARRAELAEGESRRAWELDRADALEAGGQVAEAAAVVEGVVSQDDWRAVFAWRRLAERAGDRTGWAHAGYALAQLSHDREWKLTLLREALDVYSNAGATDNAIAACRRIVSLDPTAAELEPLLQLLREADRTRDFVEVLTETLAALMAASPRDEAKISRLLRERAGGLTRLHRQDLAIADLEAVLEHDPNDADALRRRADLALVAGDKARVVDLCARYLRSSRQEVERLLSHVLDGDAGGDELQWDANTTQLDPRKMTRRAGLMRAATSDPFGGTTALDDLSFLIEQERALHPHTAKTVETPVVKAKPLRIPAFELDTTTNNLVAIEPRLEGTHIEFPDQDPTRIDSDVVAVVSYDQLKPNSLEDATRAARSRCERELALASGVPNTIALHVEVGRLCENLGETKAAETHYKTALLADGGSLLAMRGLRRIAAARGDLGEVLRLIDGELAQVSRREGDALLRYRLDLLLALGEREVARVAVKELLDRSPHDLAALVCQLELAFEEDRADELRPVLERLDSELAEPGLRAAVLSARAVLAAHRKDPPRSALYAAAAADADPTSPARQLLAVGHGVRDEAAGAALFDVACRVEGDDPITAAAIAMRVHVSGANTRTIAEAAHLAVQVAPHDPLVARIATESALTGGDRVFASHACLRWSNSSGVPVERAYAAARAAELEPLRLGKLWTQVLELDPGDEYAQARVRGNLLAAGDTREAVELALSMAMTGSEYLVLRTASDFVATGQKTLALEVLTRARAQRPQSLSIGLALGRTLASAERWIDRARLLGELAASPATHDTTFRGMGVPPPLTDTTGRDVMSLRCALAWDKAAQAAIEIDTSSRGDVEHTIIGALEAWDNVLADHPRLAIGHASAIALAEGLIDPAILIDVLARAQAAASSPWDAWSLGLRRARLLLASDPRLAQEIATDAVGKIDDPRFTLVVMLAAVQRHEHGEAATALEVRADRVASPLEAATLRVRAARIALDAGDPRCAIALLRRVEDVIPRIGDDLIDVALRANGEVPPSRTNASSFARAIHDADRAVARRNNTTALELYRRALQNRPTDPFAAVPLVQLALALRRPEPISELVQAQLRAANAMEDSGAKADAYELTARVDEELRGDKGAARLALSKAWTADPRRTDLALRIEHALTAAGHHRELLELRERQLGQLDSTHDRIALTLDAATLAVRDKRPDATITAFYRRVLDLVPTHRLAMLHVESSLRRAPVSEELAALEDHVAASVEDPRTKAAFLTRAGEMLADLGKPTEAVQRFARATDLVPTYRPALEAWYRTALASELWLELAEATTRKANLGGDAKTVGGLHYLAGVALMDKARANKLAIAALKRAFDADPTVLDAFVRLRQLFEAEGNAPELGALLRRRVEGEREPHAQMELHTALAEHYHATGDRDAARAEYRAVLRIDPAAVRAHAAIADLASEQGSSQHALDAVLARIPLERDPRILRRLHTRLALLYANDPAKARVELERARALGSGDIETLAPLADLAIAVGDWQVALDACEKLVTMERDPERLASHYRRAAKVFTDGIRDRKRAERSLLLAAESAPTSSETLYQLVDHYRAFADLAALDTYLDQVAQTMRARIARDVNDGVAYAMLARALVERRPGKSSAAARAAAEVATLLGTAGEPEQRLLAESPVVDMAPLVGPLAREQLLARAAQPELFEIFSALGSSLAKHVGVDLGHYGVRRKDRLPPNDPVVSVVREIATLLGVRDVDVYVSSSHPFLTVAEPTQPASLVLGTAIVGGGPQSVRFATGAALKLAELSLSIPARLSVVGLGVLALALVRLSRPDIVVAGIDMTAVSAETQSLRRSIPSSVLDEMRHYTREMKTVNHHAFARDLKLAGLRAGLASSGSLLPGLAILTASLGTDITRVVADPLVHALIRFAIGDR